MVGVAYLLGQRGIGDQQSLGCGSDRFSVQPAHVTEVLIQRLQLRMVCGSHDVSIPSYIALLTNPKAVIDVRIQEPLGHSRIGPFVT
jgi:hypothetical protein